MRQLYALVGVPGSGKSYWIAKHNLEPWTISSDFLRNQLVAPEVKLTDNSSQANILFALNQHNEKEVWKTLRASVKSRMKLGQTIFVDATHLFKKGLDGYNNLAKEFGYRVCLIDFMKPLYQKFNNNYEEIRDLLIERDKMRTNSVGQLVINDYLHRYEKYVLNETNNNLRRNFTTPDEVSKKLSQNLLAEELYPSFDHFNKIYIIGDVHGDFGSLEKIFKNHERGNAYIFVGDYLDRGYKNAQVLDFLLNLVGNNIFLLKGNHEQTIEKYLRSIQEGKPHSSSKQFTKTLEELRAQFGVEKTNQFLQKLVERTVDFISFNYDNQKYLVSHAGIEPILYNQKFNLFDENTFVRGLPSLNEDSYHLNVDRHIADQSVNIIQLHGHRNNFNEKVIDNKAFNLTANGEFRYAILTHMIEHPLFYSSKPIDGEQLNDCLKNDDGIDQLPVKDGIIANNFSRQTFVDKNWSPVTTQARGLFTRDNNIVGRGFQKFFELNENDQATLTSLNYPVKAYVKHNGYLAIAFYDQKNEKIIVLGKSGKPTHSKEAEKILKTTGEWDKVVKFYKTEEHKDYSVTFEIVDPEFEEHIIDYKHKHAFPLMVIENDLHGQTKPWLADEYFGINKYLVFTANNKEELQSKIKEFEKKHPYDREGLVLYAPNKQLKVKTPFYHKAKELRSAMEKKHETHVWRYGAKEWYDYVKEHEITEFSPELALKLAHQFD